MEILPKVHQHEEAQVDLQAQLHDSFQAQILLKYQGALPHRLQEHLLNLVLEELETQDLQLPHYHLKFMFMILMDMDNIQLKIVKE